MSTPFSSYQICKLQPGMHGLKYLANCSDMVVTSEPPMPCTWLCDPKLRTASVPIDALEYAYAPEELSLHRDSGLGMALHSAISAGKVEIVRLLLQNGASTTAQNTLGQTSRQMAEELGNEHIMEVLRVSIGTINHQPRQ
jgi:hypothetical protein